MNPSEFLKDFFAKNKAELEALPRYQSRYSSGTTIIPDSKTGLSMDDVELIGRCADEFMEHFILPFINEIRISLGGHLPHCDGKTLVEVMKLPGEFSYSEISINAVHEAVLPELAYELDRLTCSPDQSNVSKWPKHDSVYLLEGVACEECGKRLPLEYSIHEKEFRIAKHSQSRIGTCVMTDHNGTVEYTIDAPSGKLVFANDISALYQKEWRSRDSELATKSLNSRLGRLDRANNLGKVLNQLYLSVGNEEIHVFERKCDGQLFVANPHTFTRSTLKGSLGSSALYDSGYRFLGEIETYRWAVTGVDYGDFEARKALHGEDFDEEYFVVDLKGATSVKITYDANDCPPWYATLTPKKN